jgi:hypothetical protein
VATLRTPPYSAEAEQGVLGALLQEPQALALIADKLTEHSFFQHAHRLIWSAIVRLQMAGRAIDPISVHDECLAADPDAQFGGMRYLLALSECVPSARNIRAHAEIVAERAASRLLIASLDGALNAAWKLSTPLEDRIAAAADAVRRAEKARQGDFGGRVVLMDLSALQTASAAVSWLCKGVVPANSLGMLFGGSGTFKTFLALDLALHVAHGLPWMGRKTRQGAVVYLAAEGGTGIWGRIYAWHRARALDWRQCSMRVVTVPVDLLQDAWRVADAVRTAGLRPDLIVIDTLSQTYSGDENAAGDVARYLREISTQLRAPWQCAVLLLHHSGHAATERPRGSSAIRANLDFLLGAFRDENEMMATLTCVKMKDGQEFADATFRLVVEELGHDADGDKITQLVARHLTSREEVQEAMRLDQAVGRGGRNHLLLRLARHNMPVAELRKAFYAALDLDTAEARRQAYSRAMQWAKGAGFLAVDQGFVVLRDFQAP